MIDKYYQGDKRIILQKGGESLLVKIGNTNVDIMHGYNTAKTEPCAIITIYPYDDKKTSRVLVYNDRQVILSR